MRNEIKSIEKVMERLVARSNGGFNIYDEVFEINEILKKLKGGSNMNLLETICNKLGVELDEKWTGIDNNIYILSSSGNLCIFDKESGSVEIANSATYRKLLAGELKPVWKPMIGTVYYVPRISCRDTFRYDFYRWEDDDADNWLLKNNLIFKTEKEAMECAEKMLGVVK